MGLKIKGNWDKVKGDKNENKKIMRGDKKQKDNEKMTNEKMMWVKR